MKSIRRLSTLLLVLTLFACGAKKENEALKAEIEKIKKENEAFLSKTKDQTVTIEGYKALLKEIDNNLMAIDNSVVITGELKNEMNKDLSVEETILMRIQNIAGLMENSKLKIQSLDRTLNELRKKYGAQSEEVLSLNQQLKSSAQQLVDREKEFNAMKSGFESDIEGLEKAYAKQVKIAEELKDLLDRAFYYAGSAAELSDKGIIEKEGGFIGIGRVKVLNANSPESVFTKISKETSDSLVFQSKTLKLITEHAAESFSIKESKTRSVLYIKDKKAFWKQGNYLVVQIAKAK